MLEMVAGVTKETVVVTGLGPPPHNKRNSSVTKFCDRKKAFLFCTWHDRGNRPFTLAASHRMNHICHIKNPGANRLRSMRDHPGGVAMPLSPFCRHLAIL